MDDTADFLERVRAFQTRHGLKQDAIVGPITWGVVENIETTLEAAETNFNNCHDDLNACEDRKRPAKPDTGPGALALIGMGAMVGLIIGLAF